MYIHDFPISIVYLLQNIFHEQKKSTTGVFSFGYSYPLLKKLVKLSKTGLAHMPNTNSPFLLSPSKKREKSFTKKMTVYRPE